MGEARRVRRLVVVGGAGSLETAGGRLLDGPRFPTQWKDGALKTAALLDALRAEPIWIGRSSALLRCCHWASYRIIYYSPLQRMRDGAPFTAIGEVAAGEPKPCDMGVAVSCRIVAASYKASGAPIHPLLPLLSFARDRPRWGIVLLRGVFQID